MNVLAIEGLEKRYKDLTALSGVSLSIRAGEIFALLGPNGAGKTTLIGAVCGLVKKTAGTIRLFGRDVDEDPVTPRYQVGLVPQEINFDPFFTVEEVLKIQLGFYGQTPKPGQVEEVLEALSLLPKAKAITRALSGGMKRRLLIAKALVHKPKLVFLDEPTAGVDVELRRDLWTYVRALAASGTTIVLTTHYLEEAEELADRVGVIHQGRLLLTEDKGAVLRRLGEKRLTLRLERKVSQFSETLRSYGAVLSEDGRTLSFVARGDGPSFNDVLRAVYREGLPVEEVDTTRPKLEDVLLSVLKTANAR